jgi:hypothetical protein
METLLSAMQVHCAVRRQNENIHRSVMNKETALAFVENKHIEIAMLIFL